MTGVAAYTPLATVIRLEAPLEPDVTPVQAFDRAAALVPALEGLCSPLALLLLLGVRTPGVPALEYEPDPGLPVWRLVEGGLPTSVVVRAPEQAVWSEEASLTVAAIHRWQAVALHQDPPGPGLEVVLATLRCTHVRAPVEGSTTARSYPLSVEGTIVELPVEQRFDGPYVLAPAQDLPLQPPVSWSVSYDGSLFAELWVNWSPWRDPGRDEGTRTVAAVQRLQARGWRLREPVYELGLHP